MRSLNILLMLFALLLAGPARAQDLDITAVHQPVTHVLSVNALMLGLETLDVTYEHVLAPQWSVAINPAVKAPVGLPWPDLAGAKLGVGGRWYPQGEAPHGWVMGLDTFYAHGWNVSSRHESGGVLCADVTGGYAWLVAERVHISVSGGLTAFKSFLPPAIPSPMGVVPALQASIGAVL